MPLTNPLYQYYKQKKIMKSIYLLTLTNSEQKELGKIAMRDNSIGYISKAIGEIENNPDYYLSEYVKDVKYESSTSNDSNAWLGSYHDTVRWDRTYWSVEEIKAI